MFEAGIIVAGLLLRIKLHGLELNQHTSGFRLIAADHIGYRTESPPGESNSQTPESHSDRFASLRRWRKWYKIEFFLVAGLRVELSSHRFQRCAK